MKKLTLSRSISLLLSGGALLLATSTANASSTYYNTWGELDGSDPDHYTDNGASGYGTDGWTHDNGSSNLGPVTSWLGTAGGARPFGFTGSSATNWAAEITNAGDSLEISQADAATNYGTGWGQSFTNALVNIDTAKGGWFDGNTGWGHNTDIGLFKSNVDVLVTLNASTIFNPSEPLNDWNNFGVTVFTGMDTSASYTHHYQWNCPVGPCSGGPAVPYTTSNPGGTTGVVYDGSIGVSTPGQAYSATMNDVTGFTFLAQAGQVYSIYLGGNSGAGNFDPHAGYVLNITTAPVPVPGAVWLFGSAFAGLIGFSKRRKRLA